MLSGRPLLTGLMFLISAAGLSAEPLKIAYSDWPGWVAFEVAIQKGWFKEAGVDVEFTYMDYAASMDAFAAGQVDAVTVTNGDMLVIGAGGKKGRGILINDYSNGNDMIIAKPGISKVMELKGQKVAVEVGLVDHLLLLKALEANKMKESDIIVVNTPTDQTPQALASGEVAAIAAWQPNSGRALKAVPGSKAIYTSADAPGLIYDLLVVSQESLEKRRADWVKVVAVWDRIVNYIEEKQTQDDAVKIMAARAGVPPEDYKELLAGTALLTLKENQKHFKKGKNLDSVYGSSAMSDQFFVDNKVYEKPEFSATYIDESLVKEAIEMNKKKSKK